MKTKEQYEELVAALGFDPASTEGVDLTVEDMILLVENLLRHVDVLYERITSLEEKNLQLGWQTNPDRMGQ